MTKLPMEMPDQQPDAVAPLAPAREMPAGYAPPTALDEESGVDPRRLLDAVLRHKWLVAACSIAGTVLGFVASRFQDPEYQAQATIWVEVAPSRSGPIQQGQLLENTNWVDLLRSYTVLDSVVREQRLYLAVENAADSNLLSTFELKRMFRPGTYELRVDDTGRRFQLAPKGGAVVQEAMVGDSVGPDLGFSWVPDSVALRPGRTSVFRVSTPRQAALDISERLDARLPPRDGNFMRLFLTGADPVTTAATLNTLAEQFVHVAAQLKREKLTELSRILNEQLQAAAGDLRGAEVALETFRVSTITEPSDFAPPVAAGLQQTQAPALANFFTMKTESDQLRRDREGITQALQQPPDALTSVTLEIIPSVRGASALMGALSDLTDRQATLRALRTRYTDTNPQVVRVAEEIATLQSQNIPALLRALLEEIRVREQQLNQRLDLTSRDLRQIPTRSIEEARLRREVTIADQLYTTLQARYSEARLAEASSIPDVRILDPAVVPDRPTSNTGPIFILGGILGGFGLAIGIALLLDRFDRRLRYPDQVTRELGLTILGAVPRVQTNGGARGEGAAQVVEALRTVRLNLVHAYGAAGPLVTTVTSPGSGDGKSFVASNLALAFADAGHRTLLIDGDIRRGTLHRALGAQRKPGLLDYLGGQAAREDVVQKTRVPAVDFIGCGTRKMGGPELLASPAMSQLLIGLRSQYSVIILDSAPLGAGVDPLVLGSLTGSLLLVLRTGVTDKELATAKLGDLDRLPIRVLGAVLNDVKPSGVYRYYSYLPGYRSDDEQDSAESETRRLGAGAS